MPDKPEHFDLDLGDGHWLSFIKWSPDRTIEANRVRYEGIPDIPKLGATVTHLQPKNETGLCESAVLFAVPNVVAVIGGDKHTWRVESWDPLTLSPSLLCKAACTTGGFCDDHGFIRAGKWVRA